MDAQRFDTMAKAVGRGTTRRQALRLAGGGLAGALLAAAGVGNRAGAQEPPVIQNCRFAGGEGAQIINPGTDDFRIGLPCGGDEDCPQGRFCTQLVTASGRVVCRCVEL